MKNIKKFIFVGAVLIACLSSCIKDNFVTLNKSFVEFDAATYNANAVGVTYPILTKVVRYGEASNTADPNITRTSGSIKFRINLVGPQRTVPTEVTYTVLPTVTTAVAGTHFTVTGKATIPANSSFGEVEVQILNPGATTGSKDLILELQGASDLPPSENERRLGIRIAQN